MYLIFVLWNSIVGLKEKLKIGNLAIFGHLACKPFPFASFKWHRVVILEQVHLLLIFKDPVFLMVG